MSDIQPAIISILAMVALSGLSRATVYRLIASGSLPKPLQLSPNRVGFRKSDIDAWLASRVEV